MRLTEKECWFWLLGQEYLGPAVIRRLVDANGSPCAVQGGDWSCLTPFQKTMLHESGMDPDRIRRDYEEAVRAGIRLVTEEEASFPDRLRRIPEPPAALFIRGKDVDPDRRTVGMVGARSATAHGAAFAERLARELSEAGITVVSGMALGIDGASHRGALEGPGGTIGVLGCGIDVVYPAYHLKLYGEIVQRGTLLCEYAPGMKGLAHHFIARNRLISGLSEAVIVVEARKKSGSLITAEYALNQGRDVMAVPGRPSDPLSEGTNRLIKEGAACCTCAQDVLDLLKIPVKKEDVRRRTPPLSGDEGTVYRLLKETPAHPDALAVQTGIPAERLLQILLSLELDGLARSDAAGVYHAMVPE